VIAGLSRCNGRLPVNQLGLINTLLHSRNDRTNERFIATYNLDILNLAVRRKTGQAPSLQMT
jgi:hypothetical protein